MKLETGLHIAGVDLTLLSVKADPGYYKTAIFADGDITCIALIVGPVIYIDLAEVFATCNRADELIQALMRMADRTVMFNEILPEHRAEHNFPWVNTDDPYAEQLVQYGHRLAHTLWDGNF